MKKISPSILAADLTNLESEIRDIEKSGAHLIHIDIMDGHFVPNLTFGPRLVKQIHQFAKLPLDVHIMVEEPEKFIPVFAEAGSSIITFHVEVDDDVHKLIKQIKSFGIQAGISLRPQTPISALIPFLNEADLILVMSVNPGYAGQAFMPEAIARIKELSTICNKRGSKPIIEVDGGVGLDNIQELSEAGADYFVAGSTIFNEKNRKKIIEQLYERV